jgi:spore maturation protein CgeB
LEEKGFQTSGFNHNLPEVALAWARENHFKPKSGKPIEEIGIEKIKRFQPDVIFCRSPHSYIKNNFLDELVSSLNKKPNLIAWYGAASGDEGIFRIFDLTLSNSKHLVSSLRKKDIKADFLQHAFDPIILEKIKKTEKRLNRVAFFGNLDVSTNDFRERTKLLGEISEKTNLLDVYGAHKTPSFKERYKYSLLTFRQNISSSFNRFLPSKRLNYWSNKQHLPPSPWELSKNFCKRIKSPLYGQEMLQKLSCYQIALNYHNKHTGDFLCNMRLFEATGLGCTLITDHKSDLHEYFDLESEILSYKTAEEVCSKIKFLIDNTKVADEMGKKAQNKCLNDYNIFIFSNIFCDYIKRL